MYINIDALYYHIISMYIIYLYKYYITSILLNNGTAWTWNEKKPLAHDVVVFCSRFTHSQSNMCSEQPLTSVLGELLNHWQQFQRLQRAIAVLQVETSKIQKMIPIWMFYKFLQLHFIQK